MCAEAARSGNRNPPPGVVFVSGRTATPSRERCMRDHGEIPTTLERIDGRGYGSYKELKGAWSFPRWTFRVDWVQGDPYAAPSRVSTSIPPEVAGLPEALLASPSRRVGVACALARRFAALADRRSRSRGSGRSGELRMEDPGQEVLEQTAVRVLADGRVEARFRVGLPARGRRVLAEEAAALLTGVVPELVDESLLADAWNGDVLRVAAETNEDADRLREALPAMGLIGFVADGARLPRRSGVDDRPLHGDAVVPFASPDALRVEVELPNRGPVTGMGVREGVTLIVGGGFHGKSTVLRALERGVYNHAPGDGRELVVTDPGAAKIRAEDGRAVAGVDISAFIDGLPGGVPTRAFTSPNASGSTSQAASLVEALEAGASALLIDEDTAATNFMIRDRRMQALVPKEAEPITPFVDRVRELHRSLGVSSVLVLGGSGDYLDVADTVVAMRDYRPADVTERAAEVAAELPTGRRAERGPPLGERPRRVPRPGSIDPSKGRRDVRVKVRDRGRVAFGRYDLDLSAVEQIVSWAQARTVAAGLVAVGDAVDGERSVPELLDRVMERVEAEGLDALDDRAPGDLVAFRRFELAAALNRLRSLEVAAG